MRRLLTSVILGALISLNASPIRSAVGHKHISMSNGGGEVSYSAKDYVQDGLVAMWDGIENADWGVHDQSLTEWKELISGYNTLIIGNLSSDFFWDDNSFVRLKDSRGYFSYDATQLLQDTFRDGTFTVEVVTSCPVNNATWLAQIINLCQTSQLNIYSQGVFARWRRENNGTMGTLSGATYPSGSGVTLETANVMATFSCIYDRGQYVSYLDAKQRSTGSVAHDNSLEGIHIRLGSRSYGFRGHYHSIRIYSRALTSKEIMSNYFIDQERFGMP